MISVSVISVSEDSREAKYVLVDAVVARGLSSLCPYARSQ